MAITHVAAATHNDAAPTTSLTITIPASTAADHVLVASLTNRNAAVDPSVSDDDTGGNAWALLFSHDTADPMNGTVWWKRATSGTASKTVTASGFTNSCAGTLSVYSGCLTIGNPYEAAAGESNALGDETMAGITPTIDGAMVCLSIFVRNNLLRSTQACTDPGALTERGEALSTGGTNCAVSHSSALQTTATATGNFTWAGTDGAEASIAFALKPEVAATSTRPPRFGFSATPWGRPMRGA